LSLESDDAHGGHLVGLVEDGVSASPVGRGLRPPTNLGRAQDDEKVTETASVAAAADLSASDMHLHVHVQAVSLVVAAIIVTELIATLAIGQWVKGHWLNRSSCSDGSRVKSGVSVYRNYVGSFVFVAS